jgi:hypothetical protein
MKGYLAMVMAMSMMSGQMPAYIEETPIKREKRPPSGSKEYFFNVKGEFSTDHMLKSECVFRCFAINDKNATRKFERWKESVKN